VVFGSSFTGLIAGAGGGLTLPHSLKMSSARADELTKLQIIDAAVVVAIAMIANPSLMTSSQVALTLVRRKGTKVLKNRCQMRNSSSLGPCATTLRDRWD
jgi:hypothetical protein